MMLYPGTSARGFLVDQVPPEGSLHLLRRVNHLCNRFEERWQAGRRPDIEHYLEDLDTQARAVALRHLIPLDADYRQIQGENPTPSYYLGMFPNLDRAWLRQMLNTPTTETPGAPTVMIQRATATRVISAGRVLDKLVATQLLDPETLRRAQTRLFQDSSLQAVTTLLKELVWERKLTAYQADVLCDDAHPPLVLGDYVILECIGAGGMGTVYRARSRKGGDLVALKVLRPQHGTSDRVRRFRREVQMAGRLHHPHIAGALDAGHKGPWLYLVTEWVQGPDLSRLVEREGPLQVPEAMNILWQTATALDHVHQQGMVHRDIKPANVLRDQDGRVRIIDVGLARLKDPVRPEGSLWNHQLTLPGMLMGTVNFMAPEQAFDARQADVRSDIYSLGCTLYFLLHGQAPYAGNSQRERLLAHEYSPIPSLSDGRQDIPCSLNRVFQKMLAKSPDDRYQSMRDVLKDLAQHPELFRKPTASPAPQSEWSDTQKALMLAALTTVTAASLTTLGCWLWGCCF